MNAKNKVVNYSIMLSFIFILFAQSVYAEIHYVSPTGSALWANSVNINTPCSVTTAFANAVAGDIAYFRGGTYNVPAKNSHTTYRGYYYPANSGTAGNPITFAAYPGETPLFNGTAGGTGDTPEYATIFGVFHKDYITYDGFIFQSDGGTKMARMALGDNSLPMTSYINIKNCVFNGGPPITNNDNREGLWAQKVSHLTVQNNIFYNYKETTNNHNTGGFKEYNVDNLIMENNDFYNNTVGIFLKSGCTDCTIRYNYIHDNWTGFLATPYHTANQYDIPNLQIYHNLVINNDSVGIQIFTGTGELAYANNAQIYNNTIYRAAMTQGEYFLLNFMHGYSVSIYNNIFYGGHEQLTTGDLFSFAECDYNQYGNIGVFYNIWSLYSNHTSYTTFASWASSGRVSGGINPEIHGMASNPLFQNGSGKLNQLNDFRLLSTSPCKGSGKGGIDIGANIDFVGSGHKAIAAPRNAR